MQLEQKANNAAPNGEIIAVAIAVAVASRPFCLLDFSINSPLAFGNLIKTARKTIWTANPNKPGHTGIQLSSHPATSNHFPPATILCPRRANELCAINRCDSSCCCSCCSCAVAGAAATRATRYFLCNHRTSHMPQRNAMECAHASLTAIRSLILPSHPIQASFCLAISSIYPQSCGGCPRLPSPKPLSVPLGNSPAAWQELTFMREIVVCICTFINSRWAPPKRQQTAAPKNAF